MNEPLVIRRQVQLRQIRGQQVGHGGRQAPSPTAGRVPRVARLLALALHIDDLIERGEVADYAQLARRVHLSRARITQVMKLRYLAPDRQEIILLLPSVQRGADPITERDLRPVAAQLNWRRQRQLWAALVDRRSSAQQ